jgi:hypothetical protein
MDADVVLVHAVFHRLEELQDRNPQSGLRGLHRSLYFRLLCFLQSRVYRRGNLRLAAVSRHTATQLPDVKNGSETDGDSGPREMLLVGRVTPGHEVGTIVLIRKDTDKSSIQSS